jgi:hypothetical protein
MGHHLGRGGDVYMSNQALLLRWWREGGRGMNLPFPAQAADVSPAAIFCVAVLTGTHPFCSKTVAFLPSPSARLQRSSCN